jgi:hypothetical protein
MCSAVLSAKRNREEAGRRTTAFCDVCHLAARHDSSFGILDYLGRGQRRRLECDGVHDDGGGSICGTNGVARIYMI